MVHYRDAKGGQFLVAPKSELSFPTGGVTALVRFCRGNGFAVGLEDELAGNPSPLLSEAGLAWPVHHRAVSTDIGGRESRIAGYRALVRPDRELVMGVVTTAYRVIENEPLAHTMVELAGRYDSTAAMVGAASFGRNSARTLFVCRVTKPGPDGALLLIAQNRHGGDGAAHLRLVFADTGVDAVLTPPAQRSSYEIPHVGRMEERLELLRKSSMIEDFHKEIAEPRRRLEESTWSRNRTQRLLHELWGDPPDDEPLTRDGRPLDLSDQAMRHPARHLSPELEGCRTAFAAFRRVCAFLDNESEACERGDFTKDRDERLALGAGTKLKERAWRWLVEAVK